MNWMDRMESALNYIELHLTDTVDYGALAKAACVSEYHFPRMFISLTDMTLSEYIRKRRLTCAAQALQRTNAHVIDVALMYGYESADAFTRAFYRQHKVLPSQVYGSGVQLTFYPRISFHLTIKGEAPMNYRLEVMDFPLRIVGKGFPVETASAFQATPGIWQREMENGFVPKLIDMCWEKPQCRLESLLAVIGTKPRIHDDTFVYFIGVRYEGALPEGMEEFAIAPCTWAVFPDIYDAWKRIYTEWLPASDYDLADMPIIECHYAPDHTPATELWVPIIPS